MQKYTISKRSKGLLLVGLAMSLAACGGGSSPGGGPAVTVGTPVLSAKPSNCAGTTCTETFTVTQPGYVAGMKTALNLALGSSAIGNTYLTLNSSGVASWSQPALTRGKTYTLTGVTSSGAATSSTATLSVTVPAVDPNSPSNVVTTSSCTAQEVCTVSVTFDQAGAPASLSAEQASAMSTVATLYQDGNKTALATKTVTPKATGNTIAFTTNLASDTNYTVDLVTTIDGKPHTTASRFAPHFIYSNGAYIYNTWDDLSGSSSAGYKSAWQNDFQGLQLSDLYIQPFVGLNSNINGNTLPSAANYTSYQDFYNKTVLTGCSNQSSKTYSLSYFSYANLSYAKDPTGVNTANCVPGFDITAAYKKWALTKGVETRVMPIIVSPETMFKDSTSQTTIDYLAHAVAQTIYADPSVAGATFDLEFHQGIPVDPTIIEDWFTFYSDLAKYMHQLAPTPSEQKYLSVFANDAVLSKIQKDGVNMFALLGGNNANCANDRCYIIVPRYDFGSINPWNDSTTLQSVDQLVNNDNAKKSFSYEVYSGLSYKAGSGNNDGSILYVLLENKDYFQMAFAMSGSWSTFSHSFMYRTIKAEKPITPNAVKPNVVVQKTITAPSGVNAGLVPVNGYDSYVSQTDRSGNEITQYDYVCDSLDAYQMIYSAKAPTLCPYVGDTSSMAAIIATWSAQPTEIKKYFVGVTMYQISDLATDLHYCILDNRFIHEACNVDVPAEMNTMENSQYQSTANKYKAALGLVNAFTTKVMTPPIVVSTSS